jgi:hypothetical protein
MPLQVRIEGENKWWIRSQASYSWRTRDTASLLEGRSALRKLVLVGPLSTARMIEEKEVRDTKGCG